jgi:hypothetical protein
MRIALVIALCLAALRLTAAENLIKNSGFESEDPNRAGQPADWGTFTETGEPGLSILWKEGGHEGKNAFKLAYEGKTDRFMGVLQNVPVLPGQRLKLACYARNVSLQAISHAVLGLEWKDAAGKEIGREVGERIGLSNLTDKDWTRFELLGTAPPNTASVSAAITLQVEGATDGSLLIDDVKLEIVP